MNPGVAIDMTVAYFALDFSHERAVQISIYYSWAAEGIVYAGMPAMSGTVLVRSDPMSVVLGACRYAV